MYIALYVLIGLIIGFAGDYFGSKYYEKRFNKKWKYKYSKAISTVICGLCGGLLCLYGYTPANILSYILLSAALLVIGRIDKEEMIIPNDILLILFLFRTAALGIDIFLDKDNAWAIAAVAITGVIYGMIIFLIARIFFKDGIGMGDIKLFAVIGYYVGNKSILWLMLLSFLIAMITSLIKVAKKELSMKDTVSFGPYITLSSILIMLLGV